MVHHYDPAQYARKPATISAMEAASTSPPTPMDRAIRRLAEVHEAMDSLRRDFHDRLIAAREPLGVPTPPIATNGQDKASPSEGPLMDRIRALEDVVRDMAGTVAGFRELFG